MCRNFSAPLSQADGHRVGQFIYQMIGRLQQRMLKDMQCVLAGLALRVVWREDRRGSRGGPAGMPAGFDFEPLIPCQFIP